MTQTVYARVSDEAKAWLDAQSEQTWITIAKIIDAILVDAARSGITFKVAYPVLVMREKSSDNPA